MPWLADWDNIAELYTPATYIADLVGAVDERRGTWNQDEITAGTDPTTVDDTLFDLREICARIDDSILMMIDSLGTIAGEFAERAFINTDLDSGPYTGDSSLPANWNLTTMMAYTGGLTGGIGAPYLYAGENPNFSSNYTSAELKYINPSAGNYRLGDLPWQWALQKKQILDALKWRTVFSHDVEDMLVEWYDAGNNKKLGADADTVWTTARDTANTAYDSSSLSDTFAVPRQYYRGLYNLLGFTDFHAQVLSIESTLRLILYNSGVPANAPAKKTVDFYFKPINDDQSTITYEVFEDFANTFTVDVYNFINTVSDTALTTIASNTVGNLTRPTDLGNPRTDPTFDPQDAYIHGWMSETVSKTAKGGFAVVKWDVVDGLTYIV